MAGNVAARHDFGLKEAQEERRIRAPWAVPNDEAGIGVTWHVAGSLLGLDIGLAALSLRQTVTERVPVQPSLDDNEQAGFAESVVLTSARDLTDDDRDVIAAAIGASRARVSALVSDPAALNRWLTDARIDEWRVQAIAWMAAREPDHVAAMLSLADLFWLTPGSVSRSPRLFAWGASTLSTTGSPILQFPLAQPWSSVTGREGAGFVASRMTDLKLRIAERLAELRLPAALMRDVLAAATTDFITDATPVQRDDWITLAWQAQQIPPSRIEDYIATLTASGPLVPIDSRKVPQKQP
jgi:hypothetical protein